MARKKLPRKVARKGAKAQRPARRADDTRERLLLFFLGPPALGLMIWLCAKIL